MRLNEVVFSPPHLALQEREHRCIHEFKPEPPCFCRTRSSNGRRACDRNQRYSARARSQQARNKQDCKTCSHFRSSATVLEETARLAHQASAAKAIDCFGIQASGLQVLPDHALSRCCDDVPLLPAGPVLRGLPLDAAMHLKKKRSNLEKQQLEARAAQSKWYA